MTTRRDLLSAAGLAGMAALAGGAVAQAGEVRHLAAEPDPIDATPPRHRLRFAAIGLDHAHIFSMTEAVIGGGGEVAAVLSTNIDGLREQQLAEFHAKFGAVKVARSEDEILQDPSIALVVAAPIPDQRAPLGIRVMQAGQGLPRRQTRHPDPGDASFGRVWTAWRTPLLLRAIQPTGDFA